MAPEVMAAEAPQGAATDTIELIPADLLDSHRELADRFRRLSRELVVPLGWHYLLDLVWIASQPAFATAERVLDAGAGLGVLQWFLAAEGKRVVSVDRGDRSRLALHFRRRFRVAGYGAGDLASPLALASRPREVLRTALGLVRGRGAPQAKGTVTLLRADLADLRQVPDRSVDLVVSVSALEHNSPERLPAVVAELLRVLRPGGTLLATLAAARDEDWLHVPSSGWCYTEATLRRAFGVAGAGAASWGEFDSLLQQLRGCAELRRDLSWRYRRSGRNGMPWGRWDPRYQPVGVRRSKP